MKLRVVFILTALGIVQSKLISSCSETKKFVDGHNARRLQLAKGQVSDQPAASKITYLIWDDELAAKASKWASRNKYGHNPDRSIPSGRFKVGENIYWYATTDKNYKFDPDKALEAWWNEHKDFAYKALSASDFNATKQIGHYTQMAWANTTRIGCGISQYYQDNWKNYLVVCNYGPTGNYLGQTPYKSDYGASGKLECGESDCSKMYGETC